MIVTNSKEVGMYFSIRKNSAGKYWWRAMGNNHEIMATSELMESKRACESAISVVKLGAASAPIHDQTAQASERRAG